MESSSSTSHHVTPKEPDLDAARYRFSGFQLPLIQLDETGPAYIYLKSPPGFLHPQPEYWQKPYSVGPALKGSVSYPNNNAKTEDNGKTSKKINLYPILTLNRK